MGTNTLVAHGLTLAVLNPLLIATDVGTKEVKRATDRYPIPQIDELIDTVGKRKAKISHHLIC